MRYVPGLEKSTTSLITKPPKALLAPGAKSSSPLLNCILRRCFSRIWGGRRGASVRPNDCEPIIELGNNGDGCPDGLRRDVGDPDRDQDLIVADALACTRSTLSET